MQNYTITSTGNLVLSPYIPTNEPIEIILEYVSNTQVRITMRGSDGISRTTTLTVS